MKSRVSTQRQKKVLASDYTLPIYKYIQRFNHWRLNPSIICVNHATSSPYEAVFKYIHRNVKLDENYGDIDTNYEKSVKGNPLIIVKAKDIDLDHVIERPLIILKIKDGLEARNLYNTLGVKKIARQKDMPSKKDNLKKKRMERQHNEKMRQITNFMSNNMISTNYFYEEMQRIIRDRVVKDDLRQMVSYLEKPNNSDLKKSILNYFNLMDKPNKKTTNIWDQNINDLVINVMKDPFNDGTIS